MCVSTMGCYVLCVCGGGGGGALFELSFVADVLHTWFCRDPDGCGHVKMHVHVQPCFVLYTYIVLLNMIIIIMTVIIDLELGCMG